MIIDIYNKINKYGANNKIEITYGDPGNVTCKLLLLEDHESSPGVAHGGMIAGLMDQILGTAALSLSAEENKLVSTVEFKINYLKPALTGQILTGIGKVNHKGNSLITASAEIRNDLNEIVAVGLGTFNSYPVEKFKGFEAFL